MYIPSQTQILWLKLYQYQECLEFCSWCRALSARVKSSCSSNTVLLVSSGAADTCFGLALEALTVDDVLPINSNGFAEGEREEEGGVHVSSSVEGDLVEG